MSALTTKWERWWPLLAAVLITACTVGVAANTGTTSTSTSLLVAVGLVSAVFWWWIAEIVAQKIRSERSESPIVVYPAHQAAAAPCAWLLTTPSAYGWLAALLVLTALIVALDRSSVLSGWNAAAGVVLVLLVVASELLLLTVVAAIVVVRRPLLGLLCLVVFVVLSALTARLTDGVWLSYGIGCVVVAGAVWECRTHPRSVDPRTETSA